jgi:hypothetical protein
VQRSVLEHGNQLGDECRVTRGRMMSAMRSLETALARPSPNREPQWAAQVLSELRVLEQAMLAQTRELDDENTILAAIGRDQPRLLPRIQQLRRQYADLARQISSLREQLASQDPPLAAETRQRLAWALTALRHFQGKETDLVFEALHIDIGEAD